MLKSVVVYFIKSLTIMKNKGSKTLSDMFPV